MSIQNYLTIKEALNQFANHHLSVERYSMSFFEQFDGFSTSGTSFPILYAIPNSVDLDEYANVFNFRVYCVDMLQKTRDNESFVLNSTLTVLRDLTNWLKKDTTHDLNLQNQPIAYPVNNFLVDFTAGFYIDLEITAPGDTSNCFIPFDNVWNITGTTCNTSEVLGFLTCETLETCSLILGIENTLIDLQYQINAISGMTGGTITSGQYLPLSGGSVTGNTSFINITASTISATTYFNLPLDIYITGGTYNNNTGVVTFYNNSGGTFNISGFTDVYVSGATYSAGTAVFTNTTGGTFSLSGFSTGNTISRPATEILYGTTSGVTSSSGLTYSNNKLKTIDTTRLIQLGGMVGSESTTSSLYFNNSPSPNNYNIAGDDYNTYINAPSSILFQQNGTFNNMILFPNGLVVNLPSLLRASTHIGSGAGVDNTTWLRVDGSSVNKVSLTIDSGISLSAITSPNDGAITYDGTNLWGYIGGSWKQLDNVSGGTLDCNSLTGCTALTNTYVPYIGATKTLDLNSQTLLAGAAGFTYAQVITTGGTAAQIFAQNLNPGQYASHTMRNDLSTVRTDLIQYNSNSNTGYATINSTFYESNSPVMGIVNIGSGIIKFIVNSGTTTAMTINNTGNVLTNSIITNGISGTLISGVTTITNTIGVGLSNATASVDVAGSTLIRPSLKIRPGIPISGFTGDGIITYDGTNLYGYIGGKWDQLNQGGFRDAQDSTILTGITNTILKSYLVSGGTFNTNDAINVNFTSTKTGATGTLTMRIYVNSANTLTNAIQLATFTNTAADLYHNFERTFYIKSQTGLTQSYPVSSGVITDFGLSVNVVRSLTSIDWSSDKYILIAHQNTGTGDTSSVTAVIVSKK